MQRIVVIDYGMGNLRSVSKAIESVAVNDEVIVTADANTIASADRIVCPGQGAAADCMSALGAARVIEPIKQLIGTRPFMGICMGLQVLLTHSEENNGIDCMDLVPGKVTRFDNPLFEDAPADTKPSRLKVPHMGWSKVRHAKAHPLWHGVNDGARFYFAHSYYCVPDDVNTVVGRCAYGVDFAVALAQPHLFACQFHPEKSAKDGLQLLKNFVSWDGKE